MWLEHRFDLCLTVLIFSDFIRTVICLTGDNICLEQERYVAAVRKPFKKSVHVREYKWCLQIPPRCEEDKIIYVDDYKTEDEERIRIIEKCCTGYKENTETKTCDPISCSHCVHATCNATIGKCLCDDGYIGENCDTRCSSGKWGPECALSCDCNYSTCQHTNGTCICVPGWIGERCDIPCPTGYYGENCNQKCSKCISSCDPITGECTKEKRKALENSLNNSSTEIPIKQSDNSLSTIFSNDSSRNNDIRLVRTTSDVFANLSTEKPSSTQFQNRRKYFPSTSQDYVPKYIKIIQSYSSNKPIDQDLNTNRANSSIVYIKKPIESIKKSTTTKPTDETLQQMTTINFIDIIGTTESYLPTSNDEHSLETTTEPLPIVSEIISSNSNRNFEYKETTIGIENLNRNTNILSRNENDETMEMTTKNIFVNNRKSNIDDTELLDRQKSLYHSTESSTNSFSVRTNKNVESQNHLPKIDSPPKDDDEHENIQTTAILPEEKDDLVDLNNSSSPQVPQNLPEIIVQDTKDIDSLETTETEPSDIYRTTEIIDSIQPEKTLNNQNNSHLLETFQATETTVQTQPETTSQGNQRNPVIKETYQTTEIQPEITIENQSIPVSPELTTEMRQEIEVDNQNNSDSPLITTQTLSEIIVENIANINNFGTTKIPQIERLPETTILQMVDLDTLDPTKLPQTTEILPKVTIENMGNLGQPYSTDKAETEMISTFKFREPATTVTTSYTTRENYVSDTVTIHGNQLEMEITSTKKLETLDENFSQTNVGENSLNTMQPYFEIETNRSRFPFNNSTNIRDQFFSDVSEQDRKRTYSSYFEEMTGTTETSSTALTTTFHTKLLPTATPTKINLLDRINEPEDILNKADNKTIIPSYDEPKTTPWYRATFMKPEVQIPININDSTLVNPTYHSITSDQNSNEMKKETDIVTIPSQNFTNDGSIHNMEMTLNNDSIKLFITNSNLYNSSEKEYYPILTSSFNFSNTQTPKIPNSSEERQEDLFIKFIRTTVNPLEEQKENLWTPNNNFIATVNPNLSHQTKEQKEDWTPINFVATVNPNLPTPFEDHKEDSWTPIDFDTTIIPTASAEQQEDSWTLNNIVTENLQSPNLIEEYTPDTFFTTNSTQVDTIETRNKQDSSPVIQTTTNPTNTEATIVIPLMNDTHLNKSQTNSTVSDIIKMLTSKTYFNQYQISTKIPLNTANPMQNFTIKLTPNTESSTIKIEPVLHPTNLTSHINQTQASHDDITSQTEKLLPIFTYPSTNNTYNYFIYQGNHPNLNQTLDELLNPLKELILNSQSTTPFVQTKNNLIKFTPNTFNFSEIPSTVQTPFSVSPTTENNSYETSTLINENIKLNSEIFISKNISIKIFSTPAPENKNITNEWPNMKYNQKNLDDSDIIPILREIFPRSTTQKIETTTKSFGSNDDTTFVYSNQTDVFDYETYEEVSTNKSDQTTEYSIKEEKPIKYNNLTDVIMKIYNDDEVIKDLERNNDLLRRVHDAIVKDSMKNNQTLLINQSNTQTIYHTVMITLLGIAIGIFLAIIIASIILYMTDTSRKVAKHTRARLQNTVMNKKDYVPNSVHYIQRDEFMTPLQERITIFNPKFTAEPESTFGNLLTTDCRDKVNRFITDTLRVVYDNTYDHPQSPPTNGQFVGSTFFASKSDQSAEHLYDEIPAWKQPKPIAQAQLPQYSETCEYVTKSDGPDIITTKL